MLLHRLWLRGMSTLRYFVTPDSTIHARPLSRVRQVVNHYAVFCVLLASAGFAAAAPPGALLKSVEVRYNHAQSLRLDFSETYAGISHAPSHTESGTLYLRKPGRMRWEYAIPAGKLFVSDGKDVILYTPDQHRAEKSKLKESEDMRAPLAFLLGKLDFAREFRSFETSPEGPDTWIAALPKNQNLDYSKVEFLAAPSGEILRLKVTGIGGTRLDFTFSGEQLNPALSSALFTFHAPAGVELVNVDQ
jgi:outer membrane lipoprotein carrier protein